MTPKLTIFKTLNMYPFKVSVISLNSLNLNHINNFLQTNGFFYGQIRNNIKILQKTSIHTTGFYLKKNVIFLGVKNVFKLILIVKVNQENFFPLKLIKHIYFKLR